MLRSIVISLAALAVVLGGAKVRRVVLDRLTPSAPPAVAALGPRALPPSLHGGGRDLRPRVVQTSLFSGSTHVGLSPEVSFNVRIGTGNIREVAAKLEAGARFTDRQGLTTAVVAGVTP